MGTKGSYRDRMWKSCWPRPEPLLQGCPQEPPPLLQLYLPTLLWQGEEGHVKHQIPKWTIQLRRSHQGHRRIERERKKGILGVP